MGRGLFFWCARWPGGAGFAGTADILHAAGRVRWLALASACKMYIFRVRNFQRTPPTQNLILGRVRCVVLGNNFELWSCQ